MNIDSIAKLAFTNARNKALNANLTVLETDDGVLYEVFPDGNKIEVKKVSPPIKVKKDGKINIDTTS